jgi:ABC-type siderophore export system fused ATPase/permease subunit
MRTRIKRGDPSLNSMVLQEAKGLSVDLEEEKQQGSDGQKDLILNKPRQKRVYTKKKSLKFL